MLIIDFPSSPSVSQLYTKNGITWIWTGLTWDVYNQYTTKPIHITYTNEIDMLNDQINQYPGFIYYVINNNIYYEKLTINTIAISDYRIINGNIYNSNGILSSNRVLSLSGNTLDISGTTITRYFPNGNIGINTITDNGYKLDISGTTRISSDLTIYPTNSTGDFLTVDNSNIVRRRTSNQTLLDINAIPYTGATKNVDLGEYGIRSGYYIFDTTPTNTPTVQGTMFWDEDDLTVDIILNGYRMKIGEDLFYPVKNQTGSSIAKGTNVGFAGTVGGSGRLLISPYLANGANPTSRYMGVTAETIANGEDGKVLWFGRIRKINTNAYNQGDSLYASTSSAGAFQTTLPVAPNNIVEVCAVVTKSVNNGVIFVRPQFLQTGGAIIKSQGTPLTQRSALNFSNAFNLTDDSINNETDFDINGNIIATRAYVDGGSSVFNAASRLYLFNNY